MNVSVIVPTFNRAEFLHECVASFMEWPVDMVEVVIVDDCSTDNTEQVCAELAFRYGSGRLRYFRQESNQGAPAARNRGVAEGRGDLLMFVDSDDVPVVSGVRKLVQKLKACDELDYAYGKVVPTDEKLQPLVDRETWGAAYDGSNAGLAGYHWHTMGAVYRRSCLQKVGPWNTELTGSQDWELQARVKLFGGQGEFVDVVAGYWRQHHAGRVGTETFRPDYTESVVKACLLIAANARKAGRYDQAIQLRLAKRLLVPTLRWGSQGYLSRKKDCLKQVREVAGNNQIFRLGCFLLRFTPQRIDALLVGGHDAQRLKNALKRQ
jgi:glycosyltransferase involved in cell wall biosynthesis